LTGTLYPRADCMASAETCVLHWGQFLSALKPGLWAVSCCEQPTKQLCCNLHTLRLLHMPTFTCSMLLGIPQESATVRTGVLGRTRHATLRAGVRGLQAATVQLWAAGWPDLYGCCLQTPDAHGRRWLAPPHVKHTCQGFEDECGSLDKTLWARAARNVGGSGLHHQSHLRYLLLLPTKSCAEFHTRLRTPDKCVSRAFGPLSRRAEGIAAHVCLALVQYNISAV
jgi:hypothetical protein